LSDFETRQWRRSERLVCPQEDDMSRHRKSIQGLVASLAVLAALSAGPQALADNSAAAPMGNQPWPVEYIRGPIYVTRGKKHQVIPLARGARLKIKADADGIVFESRQIPVLSIPVSAVNEITYDHASHRVSRAVVGSLGSMKGCGSGASACGAVVMADLLVAAAALPFKYTNHYVQIIWKEELQDRAIEFRVGKRDREPLLAQLQTVTGINWRDLTQEMKGAQTALQGSDPCKNPALAANDLAIPLNRFAAAQDDLNTAGACGFHLAGLGSAPSAGMTANLHRDSPQDAPYRYRVVRALRTSTIQKELNQAGEQGYRLRSDTLNLDQLPPSLLMENDPGTARESYQYLWVSASRESKLRKKVDAASQQGYMVVAQGRAQSGHIVILERPAPPNP
jgi:hypothetical protein